MRSHGSRTGSETSRLMWLTATDTKEWRWPFEKPVKVQPPAGRMQDWVITPIDAFILEKLGKVGLVPAPPASKRVLARRVYVDLVGIPPSPEELNAFLADDSPGAYESLIEKLLADPRYGERWGRHWLDLVRYGETSGLEGDGAIGNAWRYRDWVIEAFNRDMPYDRFVIQQLAGADEHSKTRLNYQPDVQGHVPTGFLRLAPWDRSNLVADEVRQNYLNEVTDATGSIFLGLTIGCAQCHDHKYDPIPTRDFYRFQAFFNATQAVNDVEVPYQNQGFAAKANHKIQQYQERLQSGPEKRELDQLLQGLRKRLIEIKRARAKDSPLTTADLRLELARGEASVFAAGVRERHAELLAAAKRTGDLEEEQALDAYEAGLLAELKVGVRACRGRSPVAVPGPDGGRRERAAPGPIHGRLALPRGRASPFLRAIVEAGRLPTSAQALAADCPDGRKCPRAAQRSGRRPDVRSGPRGLPPAGRRGQAGLPQCHHGPLRARRHRDRPLPPVPHPRLADDPGEMDRPPR